MDFLLILACLISQAFTLDVTAIPETTTANNYTLDIFKFHVDTEIRLRFARTRVVQGVFNRYDEAKEIKFSMELPSEAFISGYEMIIGENIRRGVVMEKQAAQTKYDESKDRGQSAGLVTTDARNTNKFNFKVNVAGGTAVSFILTYDELLQRNLGQYEYQLNFKPQQVIEDLRVFVRINETKPIKSFRVPRFMYNFDYAYDDSTDNELAVVDQLSDNVIEISYTPTIDQQLTMSSHGIHGQFRITYDLERDLNSPDIEVINGYFLHSFVPAEDEVESLPKAIIFCLDKSGSMQSQGKMNQLQDAMATILDTLQPYDKFSIVFFDSSITMYENGQLITATEANIERAKARVRRTYANGGTNINDALRSAIQRVSQHVDLETHVPIITFLTDGEPTSGVTSQSQIRNNVISWNTELRIPIYSLGFGNPGSGMDFNLISKISSENFGYARRIYVDSDASLQIRDFYRSLSSPILRDVSYEYRGALEDELTDTSFPYFYSGSEIMVAGKIEDMTTEISILIQALNSEGPYSKEYTVPQTQYIQIADEESHVAQTVEKMWAYLTIKQLIRKREASRDTVFKEEAKKKATQLAIKYQFVTLFTSMVVVDEDETTPAPTTTGSPHTPTYVPTGYMPSTYIPTTYIPGVTYTHSQRTTYPASARPTTTTTPSTTSIPWRNPGASRPTSDTSFVDDDPHLYVHVGEVPVCFDVYGKDRDVFLIFQDKSEDIVVTGRLTARPDKPTYTFFTEMQLRVGDQYASFTFNGLKPKLDVSRQHSFIHIQYASNTTTLTAKSKLKFSIHSGIHSFIGKPFPFFGVYISETSGYKEHCKRRHIDGVLGQFFCQRAAVEEVPVAPFEVQHIMHENELALLSVTNIDGIVKQAYVKPGVRYDLRTGAALRCWYIHNQGQKVMDLPLHKLKLNPL